MKTDDLDTPAIAGKNLHTYLDIESAAAGRKAVTQ